VARAEGRPLAPSAQVEGTPTATVGGSGISDKVMEVAQAKLQECRRGLNRAVRMAKATRPTVQNPVGAIPVPDVARTRRDELGAVLGEVLALCGGPGEVREWVLFRHHTFFSTPVSPLSSHVSIYGNNHSLLHPGEPSLPLSFGPTASLSLLILPVAPSLCLSAGETN